MFSMVVFTSFSGVYNGKEKNPQRFRMKDGMSN